MSILQIAKAGTAVTRTGDRKISVRFPKEAEMFFPTRHLDPLLDPSSPLFVNLLVNEADSSAPNSGDG
jgi:hypothetical protein